MLINDLKWVSFCCEVLFIRKILKDFVKSK